MMLINLFFYQISCTVIGIDLGCDSIKVAIGSAEKGVHRVRNYFLHDKTPNVFAYIDNSEWAYGEGAIEYCRKYPENCIQNQPLPLNNKLYFNSLEGYQITAISLKQIITNVITKLKIDKSSLSVVVAIPPTMTYIEKSYLYNSLSISNINCVRFVTTTYAPIETYVNEKNNHILSNTVILDIGHGGVRISGFEIDDHKITQKLSLFKEKVGGKRIDENLMALIINRFSLIVSDPIFNTGNGCDYEHEYQKNRVLLLSKIRRAREELTAKDAVKFEYKNVEVSLTRKDLESCCEDTKSALKEMLTSLTNKHQHLLRSGDIHIIGGCSRIPCLQAYVKQLLPRITIVEHLKKCFSVCKGACYIMDAEIKSAIREHQRLITASCFLRSKQGEFPLFDQGKFDDFVPHVQLKNPKDGQEYSIVEKVTNREFRRFVINFPEKEVNGLRIDLSFSLNDFLLPIVNSPILTGKNGVENSLFVDYVDVGWEVSQSELMRSKRLIDQLSQNFNKQLEIEVSLNSTEIGNYIGFVQEKLKVFYSASWRRISFSALCLYVKSRYASCVKENDFDCPQSKLNEILDSFKESVKSLKIDGLDEYEKKFVPHDQDQILIHSLNNLLDICKSYGVKCDDVENWMNRNLATAEVNDVNKNIGILKERIKIAENKKNYDEL